jgi:hypothetical protein
MLPKAFAVAASQEELKANQNAVDRSQSFRRKRNLWAKYSAGKIKFNSQWAVLPMPPKNFLR